MSESIKLTIAMRERIAKLALQHRFEKAVEELITKQATFALDVYNDLYDEATRRKMGALPEGWLKENESFGAQFGSNYHNGLGMNGYWSIYDTLAASLSIKARDRINAKNKSARFLGMHDDRYRPVKVYEGNHPLTDRFRDLESDRKALQDQVSSAKKLLMAALNSVTTLGKLLKGWPELEPFCAHLVTKSSPLPMVPRAQLNAMLDLPVS